MMMASVNVLVWSTTMLLALTTTVNACNHSCVVDKTVVLFGEKPTSAPTKAPVVAATATPTAQEPTPIATAMPTVQDGGDQCTLSIAVEPPPAPPQHFLPRICAQRLTAMGLTFVGQNCDKDTPCPGNEVICNDYNGGPEGLDYTEIYALVYGVDQMDAPFGILFEGPLPPSRTMDIRRNDGVLLPLDLVVEIYRNDNGTRGEKLQDTQFHSSCSQPLVCFNSFGGSTISYFENGAQGMVQCVQSVEIQYQVDVSLDLPDGQDSVEIVNATFSSSSAVQIAGAVSPGQTIPIAQGGSATATVALFPLVEAATYNGDFSVTAQTSSGQLCTGSGTVILELPTNVYEFGRATCPPQPGPFRRLAPAPSRMLSSGGHQPVYPEPW